MESKRDTKYGFDKDVVTRFNYGEKGYFKRECTRPSRQTSQNTFRNQTSTSNQNQPNLEKRIIAVNNQTNTTNANQSGPSNPNRGDQGGNACYGKIINHIKHVHKEEFTESDDSSGYTGSSDEDSSNSGDHGSESDVKEGSNSDIDSLLIKSEELKCQKSVLVKKADVASKEMEKFFSEDGSFSYQTAFMVNVASSLSKILKMNPLN
ncbi:hypothetical protein Hanom_Chr03g00188371 [Helianthus anomalus]